MISFFRGNKHISGFPMTKFRISGCLKNYPNIRIFSYFVKISGYLKSFLNSKKLSKLTKFQAMVIKDWGGAYLYYTILPIILIVIITKNV